MRALSLLALGALASACSSPPTATATCNLASLTLSGATSVLVREATTLTHTAVENSGSSCSALELASGVWATLNPNVATVSGGVVTGASPGAATISFTLLSETATHIVQVNPTPAVALAVSPANPSVAIGLTQQMMADCTDAAAFPTPCTATWSAPPSSVATISTSGLVTAQAVGSLVVTATAGSLTGQTTVTVTAAPVGSPLAYALADQPAVAGPYTPDAAYQYNSLGGPMTVTRASAGAYQVIVPGFGGTAGSSRMAIAAAVNDGAIVCRVISATLVGVTDGTIEVRCSDRAGTPTDSPFTILAVGEAALPGHFAFGSVAALPGPAGGTTVTLPTSDAWSSASLPVQVTRDDINTQGRFLLALRVPVLPGEAYAPIVTSWGSDAPWCTLSSWGTSQDVVCYPPSGGSFTDGRFAGLLLDEGRGGMRLGSLSANQPTQPSYSAPVLGFRNSSGGAAQITRTATGRYTVVFQNLGRSASGRTETAWVTTHELLTAASCRVRVPWSTAVAADLTVEVACHGSDGSPRDQAFALVVLE